MKTLDQVVYARAIHRGRARHQGRRKDCRSDLFAGRDGHIARHRRGQAPRAGRVSEPHAAVEWQKEGIGSQGRVRCLPRASTFRDRRQLEADPVPKNLQGAPVQHQARPTGDKRSGRRRIESQDRQAPLQASTPVTKRTRRHARL